MTIAQGALLALTLLVASSGAAALWTAVRRADTRTRRSIANTALLALSVLAARLALVRPALLHANFHGVPLLESILGFPEPVVHRRTYGLGSFVVLGAIARLGGRSFASVVVANQAFGVLTLALLGICIARWTGRPRALPLALTAGSLWPPMARVASSEDAHTLAVLLGCAALLALDVYARDGRRAALLPATAALLLCVHTRQTLYPWVGCAYALALGRGGRALLVRPAFLISIMVVLSTLVMRVVSTASDASEQITLVLLPRILATPGVLAALLRHHPLLDPAAGAMVSLPLGIAGLALLRTRRGLLAALALSIASYFVITLPFGLPIDGVELSFRLPLFTLWLAALTAGAEALLFRLEAWCAAPFMRPVTLAFGALLTTSLALPGWARLRARQPALDEYEFVRRATSWLPRDATFALLLAHDPAPSYQMPRRPLVEAGLRPRFIDVSRLSTEDFARGPVLFLVGLQCRAYSAPELAGSGRWDRDGPPIELIIHVLRDAYQRRLPSGVRVPSSLRPECARLIEGATAFGPSHTLRALPSENPFTLYGEAPVNLRFVRLASPLARR